MDRLAEIRRLYYQTMPATVATDLARAVALLKELDEADRQRAAVYMDGLSQMRSEWDSNRRGRRRGRPAPRDRR
jgi:hypothetical protein